MDVRGSMNDPEFQVVAAAPHDEFDNWGDQRDTYLLRAQSQRYVTQDVHGVEDLDAYGRWNYDPAYGWVWAPQVAAGWAPYQNGQWVWEDYYGWTWVDYSPQVGLLSITAPGITASASAGHGIPGRTHWAASGWRPAMVSFFPTAGAGESA